MDNSFSVLITLGYEKFIDSRFIVAIYDAQTFEKTEIKNKIEIVEKDKPIKSYILCQDGVFYTSFIEAKTIKKRYDEFANLVNGFSDEKEFYIKISWLWNSKIYKIN